MTTASPATAGRKQRRIRSHFCRGAPVPYAAVAFPLFLHRGGVFVSVRQRHAPQLPQQFCAAAGTPAVRPAASRAAAHSFTVGGEVVGPQSVRQVAETQRAGGG